MNYRHIFHAGNFADLLKHAVLTELLAELTGGRGPLTVIDTHAGAGLYDLDAGEASKTGEAQSGIGRLMADEAAPAEFEALKAAVARANPAGGAVVRYYPGSPLIIAARLRPRDDFIACELRPDDFARLRSAIPREIGAQVLNENGWDVVARQAPPAPAALLALIDPPFERDDDYAQAAGAAGAILGLNPAASIAIWTPLKDLASFDDFAGRLEDAAHGRPVLLAQARLRPLTDPMRLNGCAMLVVNPTRGLAAAALAAAEWIVETLGERGGLARAEVLGA